MKYRLFPAAVMLSVPLFIICSGCDTGNGVAGGGDPTANFYTDVELLKMKMAECAGGAEFVAWETVGTSLPLLDGLQAEQALGLHNIVAFANTAENCEDFLTSLNFDLPVETCENTGRTCRDNQVELCLETPDGNKKVTIDCEAMGLSCLDGRCTLGLCETDKCDDETLVVCDDQNIRHEFRCGYLDLDCGYGGDGFQCIGADEQCSTTTLAPTCEQNVLTWCLGGRIATLDCSAITDGRRECNQSWLDDNGDIPASELVSEYLDRVCSQKYAECTDGVTACSEYGEARFCRDGIYEDIWCEGYSFTDCVPPGGGNETAACTGFVTGQ